MVYLTCHDHTTGPDVCFNSLNDCNSSASIACDVANYPNQCLPVQECKLPW